MKHGLVAWAEWLVDFIQFLSRVLAATGLLMVAILSGYVGYLTFMPMSWWVNYSGIRVIPQPNNAELVEVSRYVRPRVGIMPVTRYTELHEARHERVIQYCVNTIQTTAETETNPGVFFELSEFIGRDCDLKSMEGKMITMQVTYEIRLPFGISKHRNFLVGPFIVADALLEQIDDGKSMGRVPMMPTGAGE